MGAHNAEDAELVDATFAVVEAATEEVVVATVGDEEWTEVEVGSEEVWTEKEFESGEA